METTASLQALTDEKLYLLCQRYGEQALMWRRKFLGLLPEVYRRRLYEKKGFGSIFEFSFKLAGVSEEQVRRVLNLEKRFRDTPLLKVMLEEGAVSINKLARVASVVTSENEECLATQVRILPKSALETFVRDIKYVNQDKIQNGLFKPNFDEKSSKFHFEVHQVT